ncbi:MAG TPA: glycosyltransferase family A protein [Candidatus Binataceae bacterium]|nr:glycosyltransferase family A protein [Candidatus Binataceae bacterium]
MSRVSVIIPVRNGAATVGRTIDSALAQAPEPPEVVVVDDGSTDDTARILDAYGDRIKVLRQRNRGPSFARNAGALAAGPEAEYFAFLDADDVWLPGMLAAMVAELDATSGAVLAFCDVVPVNDSDQELDTCFIDPPSAHAPTMEELLTRWWPILTSAAVMRRAAFERAGGFDESFTRPGFEDPFMWLVMREEGDFIYIPQRLVRYRTTPPHARMMKYAKGYRIFSRLVTQRYGQAGRRLIRESTKAFVAAWGYAGLVALREGDRLRARQAFACALRYGPFELRTASRWLRTFLPIAAARALSGRAVRENRVNPELENYFR